MIFYVQVFVYYVDLFKHDGDQKGCSVRIGRGYDHTEPLRPDQCLVYEFVEYSDEVREMIKTVRRLSPRCRQKDEALEKLETYLRDHAWKRDPVYICT